MIETERLLLRKPTPADAEPLVEAYSDPEVMRHIGDGATAGIEGSRAWVDRALQRWDADGFGALIVERAADGRVLGRSGFLVWDAEAWRPGTRVELDDRCEVEIGWILARAHWGNGYATEAAAACRDHAFDVLGLRRVVSLIAHGNDASVHVAEKIGERYERDVERTDLNWRVQLFAVGRP